MGPINSPQDGSFMLVVEPWQRTRINYLVCTVCNSNINKKSSSGAFFSYSVSSSFHLIRYTDFIRATFAAVCR